MSIAALFRAKTWKQPKCPSTDDWLKKSWSMCTLEYYSAIRTDEILPFETTWTELENIMLHKTSQPEKVKNHSISLICGI